MFINFCLKVGHRLIWNIQSPHELRKLIVLWKVQTHNIKLDTMRAQHFLIAERDDRSSTLVVLHRGLSCGADWLRKCPHLSDTLAYRSAQNNLFLTLRVIHTLKKERKEKGLDYHRLSYEVVMHKKAVATLNYQLMTMKHGAEFVMDFVKCHFIVFMNFGTVIDSYCCHCEVIFKQRIVSVNIFHWIVNYVR